MPLTSFLFWIALGVLALVAFRVWVVYMVTVPFRNELNDRLSKILPDCALSTDRRWQLSFGSVLYGSWLMNFFMGSNRLTGNYRGFPVMLDWQQNGWRTQI